MKGKKHTLLEIGGGGLEITPGQRYVYTRRLKASKMCIKKRIVKDRQLFLDMGRKSILKVLTLEATKVYKTKNKDKIIKIYG